jgi:hypothetical protein
MIKKNGPVLCQAREKYISSFGNLTVVAACAALDHGFVSPAFAGFTVSDKIELLRFN